MKLCHWSNNKLIIYQLNIKKFVWWVCSDLCCHESEQSDRLCQKAADSTAPKRKFKFSNLSKYTELLLSLTLTVSAGAPFAEKTRVSQNSCQQTLSVSQNLRAAVTQTVTNYLSAETH